MAQGQATPRARGFTLIEIMVVLVILGLLAALVVPAVMDRPDQARAVKARQDLRALESALKLYRLDNYRYPSTEEGLAALVSPPPGLDTWRGPYLESLPPDPWGRPYRYRAPGADGRPFDLFSLGADGRPGGEGADADIGLEAE
ncbi:MAG: type II secretion system protein GspG [Porticoccaceae bacterium]|nr:MAG: type II secretion system protein GspG [Porticoccaceae bacterium]